MTGYQWYINVGILGKHIPHNFIFPSLEAARNDAETHYKLDRDCYGVDLVRCDDNGWIDIIDRVQITDKTEWVDDQDVPYFK